MSLSETPSPTRPYVGPSPIEDSRLFFGREREKVELANLLIGRRIVLLHSPSGAGKTSLIQAGLAPEIKGQGFLVMPVIRVSRQLEAGQNRRQVSTNPYLASTLISLEESLPESLRTPLTELFDLPFEEYLQTYRQRLADQNEHPLPPRTLLIFDQFEEILTLDPADRQGRQGFFGGLMTALYDTRYWILVSMREDYIAGLEPYLSYFPERLNAHFQLEYLGVEMAIQAVRQPAELFGVDFNKDAARRLVDDLRQVRVQNLEGKIESRPGPYVEPVQLQVVCSNLWEATREDPACITLQDVEKWGKVDDALGKYYRAKVVEAAESTGVDERRLRRWVERQLITEQGLRSQVLAGQESQYGLNAETVRRLSYAYLLREESRRGSLWYELAHDRLVDPVREDNAEWFRQKLSLLQRQADLWEREGRPDSLVLQDAELEKAEVWAQQHAGQLTEAEQDLLERSLTLRQEKQAILDRERQLRELELQAARDLAEKEKQRAEDQAASARRFRRLLVLAAFLFLAAVLSGVGLAFAYRQLDVKSLEVSESQARADTAIAQSGSDQVSAATAEKKADIREAEANAASTQSARDQTAAAEANAIAATEQAVAATSESVAEELDLKARLSLTSLLAVKIREIQNDEPEIAALLSIEAFHRLDSGETRSLLLNRLQRASDLELPVYSLPPKEELFQVTSIAFSPKLLDQPGQPLLAWGRLDGAVVLWDAKNGDLITEKIKHTQRVTSVALSSDGRYLASGALDRQIYLWDLEMITDPGYSPVAIRSYNPIVLAFSPDGSQLAAGAGRTLFIYDVKTQKQIMYGDHTDYIFSVAWNPSQPDQVAAADASGNWIVWDTVRRQKLSSCEPECPRGVNYLAWSSKGGLLAAGGSDGNILLYEMPVVNLIGTLSEKDGFGHKYEVSGLAFSSDGSYLASSGRDQRLIVWDVSRQTLLVQKNLGVLLLGVAFAPMSSNPNFLAAAGGDSGGGNVFLYEMQPSNPLYNQSTEGAVEILPDDAILLPAADPFTNEDVRLALEAAGFTRADPPTHLTIEPQLQLIATSSQEGQLTVLDITERAVQWSLTEEFPADALAFSMDSRILAYSICVEKDSEDPFAGCVRSSLNLLDLDTGQSTPLALKKELSAPIDSLVFHPDGERIFAGQRDGQIVEIGMKTGEILLTRSSPHADEVTALAFSPDAKLLASTGMDGRITLWFADRLSQIGAPLSGAAGAIQSLRFDRSGKLLYSADVDGMILQWDVNPESWVTRNCVQAGRNLTPQEWEEYLPGERKPSERACPDFP